MALIKCHECGNEVSSEAETCPKCGVTPKSKTNTASAIIGLAVAGLAVWYFFGGGLEQQAAVDMAKIEQQVAVDAVKQYRLAKQNGGAIDLCVHAGMVSAAYLQAKDEANYKSWKKTEKSDCSKAGMTAE
jgi:hypothetical protein